MNKLRTENVRVVIRTLKYIALVWVLVGCTVRLAPAYDAAIVEQLITNNIETMQFFASVSEGAQAGTFSDRQACYAKLIGQFDALVIQANARPTPRNGAMKKVMARLKSRDLAQGLESADAGTSPSVTAMSKIVETLHKIRTTDKRQGVTGVEVAAFKGMISVHMDQALTYEQFLER